MRMIGGEDEEMEVEDQVINDKINNNYHDHSWQKLINLT